MYKDKHTVTMRMAHEKRSGRPQNNALVCLRGSYTFLMTFFETSGIHGFFYFAQKYLLLIEKIFWLVLIIISFCMCFIISYKSYRRYEDKSVVVTIETDHYYWNTTLPSLTICPTSQRIDRTLFDKYCSNVGIFNDDREEFFKFIESLANSSYENFEDIQVFPSIEKLKINPNEYMHLIYALTEDFPRNGIGESKIRVIKNLEYGSCEQVLTEYGICYTSNNFLAQNLSTRQLLFHENPQPTSEDMYYRNIRVHDIIFGNLYDGDTGYNFAGFTGRNKLFVHSPYETIDITKKSYDFEYAMEYQCLVNEIIAEENLQEESRVSQRKCRFVTESNLTHYPVYTKQICLQECRLNLVYKICRCIPHFYPNQIRNPKEVCHYSVLKDCVAKHKEIFLNIHDDQGTEINCNCEDNCLGSILLIGSYQVLEGTTELLGSIGGFVLVKYYPLIRYKRKILFTFEDLMVSIGGTAGLFVGFCVLGAIEIIYFFTLRLFWYIRGRR